MKDITEFRIWALIGLFCIQIRIMNEDPDQDPGENKGAHNVKIF